ncbi:MAG: SRPBCC family protein [Bacteroidales bacterium]|nr:SRPBCC family protein [Bacteroidales bacterium]
MKTYEGKIVRLQSTQQMAFERLSNLEMLNAMPKEMLPEQVKDMECDADHISFNVDKFGQISLNIIEREPYKTIKFEANPSPIQMNLWIQLIEKEGNTYMKMTAKADVPFFLNAVIGNKAKEALDKLSDSIAQHL